MDDDLSDDEKDDGGDENDQSSRDSSTPWPVLPAFMVKGWLDALAPNPAIALGITADWSVAFGQVAQSFVRSAIPSWTSFATNAPVASFAQSMFKDLSIPASILGAAWRPFLGAGPFDEWKGLRANLFPANLARVASIELDEIDRLGQEGITVYCVPRAETVRRLLGAPDGAARRRVLGDEFDSILDDCHQILDLSVSEETRRTVPILRSAITAARAGHIAAAQALATNTLDTLLQQTFDKKTRYALTNHQVGRPPELDDLQIRLAWVMVPIWWSYREFRGHVGTPAPALFSRHATVHGVSPRQFSRRNTVQVMMLATSLIAWRNDL